MAARRPRRILDGVLSSGREPLYLPSSVGLPRVEEPIVQPVAATLPELEVARDDADRKSTRLNSSHG